MTTLCWPDWLDDIWAKSPESKADPKGETLARHTWNVLETLAGAIKSRAWLSQDLNLPGLWNSLFWSCWLHDVGKVSVGFQDALRGRGRYLHRHEVLSLAFVDWLSSALSEDEQPWVVAAIVSHHRDADEINRMYGNPSDPDDCSLLCLGKEMSEAALVGIWTWFDRCVESWVRKLGVQEFGIRIPALPEQAFAIRSVREQGHIIIRDHLRNYRLWLRDLDRSKDRSLSVGTLALRGGIISADHTASAHVGKTPTTLVTTREMLLDRWKLSECQLHQHQKESMRTAGDVVLVAPTGSGKTEAALLWACSQDRIERPLPRLFYALPYQASMNAMYDRLNERCFPGLVGLEHSRSVLALYRRFLDEEPNPKKAESAARVAKNLARLHQFPVKVLSPYQILKAPYRLKGYETLLNDCFGAAFVMDEIHAYDPKRLAMILATVRYLREKLGAHFLVMSATLPSIMKRRLKDALGDYVEIQASQELFEGFKRHRLHILDGDMLSDRWLARIVSDARNGRSVLVCCNTVSRAKQMYRELASRLQESIETVLLHGQFNSRDRLEKEQIVRVAAGRDSQSRRPIVLVATQVVEVSLDIDLDVIYTDPAPVDALIQRFGRVNRAGLKGLVPVYVFTQPADGQGVYRRELVEAALTVLARNDGNPINEGELSEWLDDVYQGGVADEWNREYQSSQENFERSCLWTLRAFNSDERLEEIFYQAFDGTEVLPVCKEKKYRDMIDEGHPLEAAQELVSMRWTQVMRLQKLGKVRNTGINIPMVVDVEYSNEFGLQLQTGVSG